MVDLRKIGIVLIACVGIVIIVLLLTSPLGWVTGIVGIIAAVTIFLMIRRREDEKNPVLEFKRRVLKACEIRNVRLGWLVSMGGYDAVGAEVTTVHQAVKFGRIKGFTQIKNRVALVKPLEPNKDGVLAPKKRTAREQELDKKFETVYFFEVEPQGIKKHFPFSLFFAGQIYAVLPTQLLTLDFARGLDVTVKGTSWRDVEGIFWLNDLDITPSDNYDYLNNCVEHITLGKVLEKLPALIDDATDSNPKYRIERKLNDGVA